MQPAEVKAQKALELARGQLDFAVLASSAPRVKDVIARAQTIVPIVPTHAWWKPAAATAGAVGLAVAALLLPWLPTTTRLSLVQVSFEQVLSRQQAQAVEAQFLRKLPGDILTSGSFSPIEENEQPAGHLVLQLAGLNRVPADVAEAAETALAECPAGAGTAQIHPEDYIFLKEYFSPWDRAKQAWRRLQQPKQPLAPPSAAITQQIVQNVPLYRKALKRRLGRADYELTTCDFIPKTGAVPPGYDFIVPGWPLDIALAVREYPDLTDTEQAGIRRVAEELLRRANLLDCSRYRAADPLYAGTFQVQVVDAQTQRDCYLTRRLQAWLVQPKPGESADRGSAELAVQQALAAYLPKFAYRLSYERQRQDPAQLAQLITVELTGEREKEPSKFFRMLPEDEEVEL